MTYIYKWMTDQKLMKRLKDDINANQAEMRKSGSDTKKLLSIQKKAMDANMQYMMHSLKPTLVTFLPIIIIFAWLSTNLAYEPIKPYEEFKVTVIFKEGSSGTVELIAPQNIKVQDNAKQEIKDGKVEWVLKGAEGEYTEKKGNFLEIRHKEKSYYKDVIVTNKQKYAEQKKITPDSEIKEISLNNKYLRPMGSVHFFSWYPGWLGVYIILSIIFSLALRKVLNIY